MKNRMDEIPVSPKLNKTVEEALKMVEIRHQKAVRKRWLAGIGSAAAVCLGFMLWGSANPALAARLPLIGHIFEQMETRISDKGEYSSGSVRLIGDVPAKNGQDGEMEAENGPSQADNPYVQSSNGITCTISEANYTKKALYLALSVESEEAFPPVQERMGAVSGGGEWLRMKSDCKIEGIEDAAIYADYAEGQFLDGHTFAGIVRVDITHQEVEIPDAFVFRMNISEFFLKNSGFDCDGAWNFSFDVKLDSSKFQTVKVDQTNERGEGILSVEKTPYELTAQPIIPEGKAVTDYIVIICDADGDLLNWQGDIADTFQTYGRNTDMVSVFLCDETAYMDELKGYYWAEDYAEKKKTKTFAQYLEEHALYWTQVTFAE